MKGEQHRWLQQYSGIISIISVCAQKSENEVCKKKKEVKKEKAKERRTRTRNPFKFPIVCVFVFILFAPTWSTKVWTLSSIWLMSDTRAPGWQQVRPPRIVTWCTRSSHSIILQAVQLLMQPSGPLFRSNLIGFWLWDWIKSSKWLKMDTELRLDYIIQSLDLNQTFSLCCSKPIGMG